MIIKNCYNLQLTIVFLGGKLEKFTFTKPGALHRARWMAKVIYAIKIMLFKSQFKMTKQEQNSLKKFAIFAVHFYVPNWFVCSNASAAPRNDLQYLKSLQDWDDKEISSIATKALSRHLWYLSEPLVSL